MSLYYYTTTETMSFILKKGDIFATNISYLNDSEEYINGLKELRALLCGDIAGKYAQSAQNHLLGTDAYRDAFKEAHDIYSISFSQEKDLLSQWYMYAKESGVRLKMDIADDDELAVKVFGKEEADKEPNLHLQSKCKKVHYYTRIGMEEDEYARESRQGKATDEIKVDDIDEEKSIDDFVSGLGQYQILKQDCEKILEDVRSGCSAISNRRDVLYEVLERYMNEKEGEGEERKVLLLQEYLTRNTYTSKNIIVRKSNVPYEF